ncbi:MAG: hypothetical protein COA44_06095 [Arcobacter sp.]|nr:MAG: hypothetical protein COA44_06095 [Arcobacter sp.]
MKKILFAALAVVFIGCSGASKYGIKKPSIWTAPTSYAKNFPINKVTRKQLIEVLGLPEDSKVIGDEEYLSYRLGTGEGVRQYVYTVKNDIVVNFTYNDNGPSNGVNTRDLQAK